jgi:hypothetical protein
MDDLNFTETDTIIDDSIYTGWGGGGDFQMEFNGSDMLMTGIATVGLTLDLDSGSVNTETFDITAYNMTLDAAGAMLLIGNLDLNAVGGTNSPDITLTDNTGNTLVIVKADNAAATVTATDGLTLSATEDNAVITIQTQAGSPDAGDDLVIECDNFDVDADGTVSINGTDITTATGLDGEAIDDNTIDEDSIDWGSGTDQVDYTDITTGNIATATAFAIDVSGAGLDLTLSTDAGAGEDLIVTTNNLDIGADGSIDINAVEWIDSSGNLDVPGTFTASSTSLFENNINIYDGAAGSPTLSLTDESGATDGTLVLSKPTASAALISSTVDGLTLSVTPTAKPMTLNVAGGNAAGEDIVITAHNFSITAAGVVTVPTTSKLNIIDVGTGLELNSVAMTCSAAELNDCDVDNRASSSLFRTLIGTQRFTVLDAASTTVYLGGYGAAFQVDAISICASGTLPIDAGGVTLAIARVSDSQSLLSGANVDLTVAVQTADQCTAPALNATPANLDVGATDQIDLVITTDGAVDTNGTEFIVSVWGSLD